MSTAATQNPQITTRRPIHSGWDGLFLCARTKQKPGIHVAAPEFDAELHIETTTIMFADVVESVRLIEQDEVGNVRRIRTLLKRFAEDVVPKHGGVVLERRGDGLLIKFPDARSAAACALVFHKNASVETLGFSNDDSILLRIGINSAAVLSDSVAIYGKSLNVTARIAALAKPGQTMLSAATCDQLTHSLDGSIVDMGECFVKHLKEPLRLFSLSDRNAENTVDLEPDHRDLRSKIAVLLFDADVTDGDAAVAAETLSEEISLALARVAEITVISRLTMSAFRGRTTSVSALRRAVGADYVVSGRLVLFGQKFRASVELCDAKSELVIWSDRVFDTLSNLLTGNSSAVATVCSAVGVSVLSAELEHAQSQPMPTLSSQSLLTGAISLMHRSAFQSYDRAEVLLTALMERHARHPLPYVWSAKQHLLRSWRGWSNDGKVDVRRAKELAERALDTNPESALALAIRGMIYSHIEKDFTAASKCYDAAIAASPSESLTWLFKSTMHSFCGEGSQALSAANRALELSPLDPLSYYYQSLAASAALTAGDLTRAVAMAKASRRLNCMHLSNYRVLAIAFGLQGDIENAQPIVMELLRLDPQFTVRKFLERSPGAGTPLGTRFAHAMRFVGVPE